MIISYLEIVLANIPIINRFLSKQNSYRWVYNIIVHYLNSLQFY